METETTPHIIKTPGTKSSTGPDHPKQFEFNPQLTPMQTDYGVTQE